VNDNMAAEAVAGRYLVQAAKQARDKQLADIVESAGQRPQVASVLSTAMNGRTMHCLRRLPRPVQLWISGHGPRMSFAPFTHSISLTLVQAGGGQMLRIDLREAAVVQNPTSGGGLGDVAEE
jgi:hypothetical protein